MLKSTFMIAALSVALVPTGALLPGAIAMAAEPPAAVQPGGFAPKAFKAGQDEIALAELAAAKSGDTEIKALAQMLIADHTALNAQLAKLGAKQTAILPGPAVLPKLSALSGLAFDRALIDAVVDGHKKSMALYTAEAESGSDAATKAFAAEHLPKIKLHLDHALAIQRKIAGRT